MRSSEQRTLPLAAGLAAWAGLTWHLARWISAAPLNALACAVLFAPAAALLIAAVAEPLAGSAAAAPPSRRRRWPDALGSALQSVWPGLLPLALLPLVGWLPAAAQTVASAVLFSSSALVLIGLAVAAPRPQMRVGVLLRAGDDRRIGVWQSALLAFALAVAVLYLVMGARVAEISDNDGAYYYGVARHMARTGRFEEPIVWHFLSEPGHIVHAPFDYWGGMTSLLLVPSLAVFGATPQTAFITIAAISALSVIALWYLVCVALPLRYRVTQLLALLLGAFSPAMVCFQFQPESTAVVHLFILLSLIAFCRRRLNLALLSGFCIFLTRGDSLILFALIAVAVFLQARRDGDRRRVARLCAIGFACVATYALWSAASFGTLTPPAPRILPFLERYPQVFDYGVTPPRSVGRLLEWLRWDYLTRRLALGFSALRGTPFTPAVDLWLVIACVPGLWLVRRRPRRAALVWVLCFVGYFLVAWAAGPGFNPWRAPFTFTPLIVLAGALGLDLLLAQVHGWVDRAEDVRARAWLASAGILGLCAIFLGGLGVFGVPCAAGKLPLRRDLTHLDQMLGGEAVASNVPWYVIAYTDSPAVSVPYNGEGAMAAVFERYRPRWLVVIGDPPLWVKGESRSLLEDVLSSRRATIGRFRLERVSASTTAAAVFRIEPG